MPRETPKSRIPPLVQRTRCDHRVPPFFGRGPLLLAPLFDGGLIPLDGPPLGLLDAEPPLGEQPHRAGQVTHLLRGLESVPQAFDITANKGKYGAINPAQVVLAP